MAGDLVMWELVWAKTSLEKKISSSVSDKLVNFGRKSQRFIQRNKCDRALNLIEFELVLRAPPFYTRKSYRFPEEKTEIVS